MTTTRQSRRKGYLVAVFSIAAAPARGVPESADAIRPPPSPPPDARWLGFVAVASSRKLTPQSPLTPPNHRRQNVVRVRWTKELE